MRDQYYILCRKREDWGAEVSKMKKNCVTSFMDDPLLFVPSEYLHIDPKIFGSLHTFGLKNEPVNYRLEVIQFSLKTKQILFFKSAHFLSIILLDMFLPQISLFYWNDQVFGLIQ